MNIARVGGLACWCALGWAQEQEVDLTLAAPPSVATLVSAAGITEAEAISVRGVLQFHRGSAQRDFAGRVEARYKALIKVIGTGGLERYQEFRLKGQAFTPANARYRANSVQRRTDSGEAGAADTSVNLLTRESIAELSTLGIIDSTEAETLLEQLGGFRTDREAMYARWDEEKDALLAAEEGLELTETQRDAVIKADRQAVRFSLLAQRRGEGLKILREQALPTSQATR